jgi:hypothetical protein
MRSPERRRLRSRAGLLWVAVVVTAFAAPPAADGRKSVREVRELRVAVDPSRPGPAVPRSFAGFSIEYPDLPDYTGPAQAPNQIFIRLLGTLGAYGNGAPSLRIGGNSQDQTWWNPAGTLRPPGVFTDVKPDWVSGLAATVQQARTPVMLGLNLALNDPANAAALVDAVTGALPAGSLDALEIGNEPDLYTRATTFYVGQRLHHRARKRTTYSYEQYAQELERYLGVLAPRNLRLAAGGFAGAGWDQVVGPLLTRLATRVKVLPSHAYPLKTCGRTRRKHPRLLIAQLLANRQAVNRVRRLTGVATAAGVAARITEANSSVCGGVKGVSDTFATALWGINAFFGYFAAGARGVNLHTWTGAFYAPLEFRRSAGRTIGIVRPLYYGMLLFARATASGAQLLPTNPTRARGVRVWATRNIGGTLKVVVVNASSDIARRLRVRLPGAGARGSVERLEGPSLLARSGVRIAGKTFGRHTFDGLLRGRHAAVPVTPRGEVYSFRVPRASAALLTVR